MITEAMLSSAAAKSCEIYSNQLQHSYDDEQHIFSIQFEKKMRKLKRKANHPFVYRSVQRVASILLALLICESTWLTIDVEARAAVFGWFQDVYETYFVYGYDGETDNTAESSDYHLGWLPPGYTELLTDDAEQTIVVIYANEAGQLLTFSYIDNPDNTNWLIDSTDLIETSATVCGQHADMFLSNNPTISSVIVWSLPDSTAFYISAFLSEADLIKAAESVEKIIK